MPTISPLSGMAEPPVSVMFAVTSSWSSRWPWRYAPFACIPIRGGIMNSISFIMDWRKSR